MTVGQIAVCFFTMTCGAFLFTGCSDTNDEAQPAIRTRVVDNALRPHSGEVWEIGVTFERRSANSERTDEFTFESAAWDGNEHGIAAHWTVCVEGAQEGCGSAAAECIFRGDVDVNALRQFEIRCDDPSDDDEDAACAMISDIEVCAIAGTLTTDKSKCDEGGYRRWDDAMFCVDAHDAKASALTGGVERELTGTSYGVTYQLSR